jgi:hypothetical protein
LIAFTLCKTRPKRPYQAFKLNSLFGWLVADGWCWFVLREEYCWLVAGGWFVVREKYCWLVADKPNEQGVKSKLVWQGIYTSLPIIASRKLFVS